MFLIEFLYFSNGITIYLSILYMISSIIYDDNDDDDDGYENNDENDNDVDKDDNVR